MKCIIEYSLYNNLSLLKLIIICQSNHAQHKQHQSQDKTMKKTRVIMNCSEKVHSHRYEENQPKADIEIPTHCLSLSTKIL